MNLSFLTYLKRFYIPAFVIELDKLCATELFLGIYGALSQGYFGYGYGFFGYGYNHNRNRNHNQSHNRNITITVQIFRK
jgi:hypothetical protein